MINLRLWTRRLPWVFTIQYSFQTGESRTGKKFRGNSFKFSLVSSVIFLALLQGSLLLQTPRPWRPSHSKSSWEVRTGWICSNSSQVFLKSVLHLLRSSGSGMARVLSLLLHISWHLAALETAWSLWVNRWMQIILYGENSSLFPCLVPSPNLNHQLKLLFTSSWSPRKHHSLSWTKLSKIIGYTENECDQPKKTMWSWTTAPPFYANFLEDWLFQLILK